MAEIMSVRLGRELNMELEAIEKKWQIDRSEVIRRLLANAIKEWKIQDVLEDIREHKKSVGKAAEECGISLWEMLNLIRKKDVNWTGYSREDLEKDLEILG